MGLDGLRPSARKKDQSISSKKNKLEKKLQFYAKVQSAVAKKTITKKKRLRSRQKKLKAYDLSALSEFLPDPKEPDIKLNCKTRQKLVLRESVQLRAVLNDSSFQTDPVAAIHKHLEKTQPPSTSSQEKRTGKDKKKTKRRKAKKPTGGSQPMDI